MTLKGLSEAAFAAAVVDYFEDAPWVAEVGARHDAYRARFGFPFIICARRHTPGSILATLERRLGHDPATERGVVLAEIGHIKATPASTGLLSTHVLDTSTGRPAAGMAIALFELGPRAAVRLASAVTNADGRTDAALIPAGQLRIGTYELRFDVGRYFAGVLGEEPAFLNIVPIRFGVCAPEAHYHVPLLVSPGGYSTYRGS